MPKLCAVLVSLFFLAGLHAQDERFGLIGRHAIEVNYQFGRILAHNSRFKAPITGFTNAIEVSYSFQTLGAKAWQRKRRFPELGGSFYFAHNADQKIFGNAYGLMGTVKFWLVRSKLVDFYVRAGVGICYNPVRYNIVTNRENNAIGSAFNSIEQVRLGVDFKLNPQLQIGLGVVFTHYSNAAIQQPNLGVNVPAFAIGIRFFPHVDKKYKYNRESPGKPEKKNEYTVRLSMALQEKLPFNGPKYPVYIGTVNYARYTSVANKVLAGASVEFNQGAYDYYKYTGEVTKFKPSGMAMNMSLFVGDEVMLGKVGLMFAAGVYVFNPRKDTPVYAKLGLNYYFVSVGKNKNTKFFIGTNLKTHFAVAQFFEMATGVAF